jgi:hypothetical protein
MLARVTTRELSNRQLYTLRNAFVDICKEMPVINLVLEACRDLAGAANRSTQIREQITANQLKTGEPPRTLKQSVVTRWNSILHNIKSTLDSKQAILAFCLANVKQHKYSGVIIRHGELFWSLLKCLRVLLQLFETASNHLSADRHITAERIVGNYLFLRGRLASPALFEDVDSSDGRTETIEEAKALSKRCAEIVKEYLLKKFDPLQDAEKMAFVLNPLIRPIPDATTQHQKDLNTTLEEGFDLLLAYGGVSGQIPDGRATAVAPNLSGFDHWGDLLSTQTEPLLPENSAKESLQAELTQYKKERIEGDFDLGRWWREHKVKYPLLSKLALRYLCIPASQTASERDFSQMRLLCTHLRHSLNTERAFKMSVVGPYLRQNRPQTASRVRSTKDKDADTQRVESRKNRRQEGLKRRFSSITPNPLFTGSLNQEALEYELQNDQFFDHMTDDGERDSDEDFEEEEVSISADYQIDDDFEHLQPARQVPMIQEGVRNSRRDKTYCEVVQCAVDRYRYEAHFFNLKNRAPPSARALFGPNVIYVKEWKQVIEEDYQFWTFVASEEARSHWSSGKQFLRHIGEIIWITEDMFVDEQE